MQRPAAARRSTCPPSSAPAVRPPDALNARAAGALRLQGSIGNRATARLLRKGRQTDEFEYSRGKKDEEKSARAGTWFRKRPRPRDTTKGESLDRPKYKAEWLIKSSTAYVDMSRPPTDDNLAANALKEVLAGNLFAILAGAQYGAKYRLLHGRPTKEMPQEDADRWVASKAIPGFKSYREMHAGHAEPSTDSPIPGAARSLVVAGFLGEGDFNWGNYGVSALGTFAKIDFGTAFDFKPVERLLSFEDLLDQAKGISLSPAQLDADEAATALAELAMYGKPRILAVAGDMAGEFAGIGGKEYLDDIVKELLERLDTLEALLKL